MFRQMRILRRRLALTPPDLCESRGDRRLLVWGDLPHWMVVDEPMHAFLASLDGADTLGRRIRSAGGSRPPLARTAVGLRRVGVLTDRDRPDATRPAAPRPRIENIAVNVTRRCNLACGFCYARRRAPHDSPAEITGGEIRRFLRDVRPLTARRCSLVLLGGEPFLEPEKLLAAAAEARRLGLAAIVSTNGTRVTPELARRIRRTRLQVQVSVDAADRAGHDHIRGEGTFDRAVEGVRRLVRGRVHTVMSMVCHERNAADLEAFFELAAELGADEARFIPLKLIGGARDSGLRPVPMPRLMRSARELFTRRPELRRLLGRDALSILANTCRYSARRRSCGTGLQTVLLDSDGSLYPCLNMTWPEFRVASIRDGGYDFSRIWRESGTLRDVRSCTSVETAGRACSRCVVRYWCLGGCRGETFAARGDLRPPAPNCADLRRAMLDVMWMLAESPKLIPPSVKTG